MSRLWVRVIRRQRISQQADPPCAPGDERDALEEAVKALDLPVPMWLPKHGREFEKFRHTSFLPDHFIEVVDFDRLEIEWLDDSGKKRKSQDPRNQ